MGSFQTGSGQRKRSANQRFVFLDAKIVGTGNDAVNLICNQHFEIVALFFLVLGGVAQDDLIAGSEKAFLRRAEPVRRKTGS